MLCIVLFLSGASALIFEFLWFRLCGLVLGNSVISAATVLASFMGGLALGNALMSRWGESIRRPIRFYALLEALIAVLGMMLVLILPHLTKILVPLLRLFLDQPFILHALRAVSALALMIIPATAMGATLPVVVKAFNRHSQNFGHSLGLLYASNTLGAVAGVLLTELIFVQYFGLKATGMLAMILNLIASAMALAYSSRIGEGAQKIQKESALNISARIPISLLAISFLTGLVFLALEIVWFRFLMLFFNAYSLNFTIMLSFVLTGISAGGFLASRIFKKTHNSTALLAELIMANAALIALLYVFFDDAYALSKDLFPLDETLRLLLCSGFLILPTSVLSGLIFTTTGKLLHDKVGKETLATGLLASVNTLGCMIGSVLGGFVLIPVLGVERSFFLSAFIYGSIVLCLGDLRTHLTSGFHRILTSALALVFLCAIIFFPFGKIRDYLDISISHFVNTYGERRVAFKEGVGETVQYLQKDLLGRPHYHRLMTNGHSMSGTMLESARYMKMFVYLPMAINPTARKAALICFGCGVTAKALTDTAALESIDMVDTSREIIDLSRVIYPSDDDNPIFDQRAAIHIEDGRFFLLASEKKFDIITGEPPPPKYRGIASLYSQEYFRLIYNRLNDGGMITYWLPVYMMHPHESKSILKAFCHVFEDCSLWAGSGYNWIMLGIKNPTAPVSLKQFTQQWSDPQVGNEIRKMGFESPEEFSSLFIADKRDIARWTQHALPLTDNFPKRLEAPYDPLRKAADLAHYKDFLDHQRAWHNFSSSRTIAKIWPNELIEASGPYFPHAHHALMDNPGSSFDFIKTLHRYLSEPLVSAYDVDSLLYSNAQAQEIVMQMLHDNGFELNAFFHFAAFEIAQAQKEDRHDAVEEWLRVCKHAAVSALKRHDLASAQRFYSLIASLSDGDNQRDFIFLSLYLLAREGQWKQVDEIFATLAGSQEYGIFQPFKAWLDLNFRQIQPASI